MEILEYLRIGSERDWMAWDIIRYVMGLMALLDVPQAQDEVS